MLTEKSLATADGTLHYGEGPPSGRPLLLLHGIYGRWHNLLPMMPSLTLRYHVFAPDLRGHGASSWTPGAYHLRDDAGDIIALLRERIGKPAVLVGHSLGGAIALATAAFAPELVQAVVAVDPPLALLVEDDTSLAGIYPLFGALRAMLTADAADADKIAMLAKIIPSLDPLTLRRRYRQFQQFDPERLTWSLERRSAAGLRLDELLPRIGCPVLLIQCNPALGGLLDDPTAATATALLADCIHLSRPEAGHNIHTDQPVAVAQMVTDFVEMQP